MSGTPVEIHWFPRQCDRFVTWGSEINLYQVRNSVEVDHRVSTSASQLNESYSFNENSSRNPRSNNVIFIFRHKFGYITGNNSYVTGIRDTIPIYSLCSTVFSQFSRPVAGRWFSQWKSWSLQLCIIQ